MNALQKKTVTIPAGSNYALNITAAWFRCLFANGVFDLTCGQNEPLLACFAGKEVRYEKNFTRVQLNNNNSFALKVEFEVGTANVSTTPGLLLSKNFPTYNFGNLGLSASGTYNGTGTPQNIVIGVDGYVSFIKIPTNSFIEIAGANNGNSRKEIYFSVANTANASGYIADASGRGFMDLDAGARITIPGSDTWRWYNPSTTNAVYCKIGEIYYAA